MIRWKTDWNITLFPTSILKGLYLRKCVSHGFKIAVLIYNCSSRKEKHLKQFQLLRARRGRGLPDGWERGREGSISDSQGAVPRRHAFWAISVKLWAHGWAPPSVGDPLVGQSWLIERPILSTSERRIEKPIWMHDAFNYVFNKADCFCLRLSHSSSVSG